MPGLIPAYDIPNCQQVAGWVGELNQRHMGSIDVTFQQVFDFFCSPFIAVYIMDLLKAVDLIYC
jgi:hypothetical protein